MLASITDDQWIYIDQITSPEEDILIKEFSVRHPRANYIDTTGGCFDGWYRKYSAKFKRMARPLLGELRAVCNKHNLPLNVVDCRPPAKYPPPDPNLVVPDLLPGIILEDYQMDALRVMCRAEVGCISAPTGSGKGELIAGITKLMDCPTVIIAESIVVIEQIKERLELRDVVEEAGLFCSGKRPNGHKVIVGSIQSLNAPTKAPARTKKDTAPTHARKAKSHHTRLRNAQMLRDLVAECDMLIIDECDRSSATNYKNLFKFWFKGRRRFGFSGTVYDPDKPVENLTLKENMGSIISSIDRKSVEAAGRIVPVNYNMLSFGSEGSKNDKSAFDIATKEWMVENPKFHELIKKLALKTVDQPGYGTLILVENLELGYKLEELIPGSKFICGDHKTTERNEVIEAFEKRESPILIGSKILARGLDLSGGCESLIIATGGKLESNFDQKVGRALRKNKIGKAVVFDFYFLCNHYLISHSRRRLKALNEMGYSSKVIFKNGTIEGEKFIKSRFKIPKGYL